MGKSNFYSVNPWFVYEICMLYYNEEFLVYAAPEFDFPSNPETSDPKKIYRDYLMICKDTNSDARFRSIIQTMETVAEDKQKAGDISDDDFDEILTRTQRLTDSKSSNEFTPVLFVIKREAVNADLYEKDGFGAPSQEFVIKKLKRSDFEALSFEETPYPLSNP